MTDDTATASDARAGALVFAVSYTGLGIVRSLGRHGIPVWVLDPGGSLARVSRYAARTIPIKGLDEEDLVELLVTLGRDEGLEGWPIIPDSDKTASFISRHRDALGEHYIPTVPPSDVLRWALDKKLTYQLADELGIDFPRSWYPASIEDVEQIEGDFPMLLKPLVHSGTDRFSIICGAWLADDKEQLLELYRDAYDAVSGRPIIAIQEMIPGNGDANVCCSSLCEDGRVLATVSAVRRRLVPIDFGSSSFVETIEPIPEVQDAAQRWLAAIGYTGVVEFEFKRHEGNGRYYLLDVNVRPWLWQPLCAYAGIDLPYLLWRLVRGEEVSVGPVKVGERYCRTPYDFVTAMRMIRRGDLTWSAYATSLRGAHHEMYQRDDLAPALAEVPLLLQGVRNRLRGR